MDRETLIETIRRLEQARTDADTSTALDRAKRIAPHGSISDLVFYGECDRTHEEIADEVLLRERMWSEGGDMALAAHIVGQLRAALANVDVPEHHYTKVSARILLEGMGMARRSD